MDLLNENQTIETTWEGGTNLPMSPSTLATMTLFRSWISTAGSCKTTASRSTGNSVVWTSTSTLKPNLRYRSDTPHSTHVLSFGGTIQRGRFLDVLPAPSLAAQSVWTLSFDFITWISWRRRVDLDDCACSSLSNRSSAVYIPFMSSLSAASALAICSGDRLGTT